MYTNNKKKKWWCHLTLLLQKFLTSLKKIFKGRQRGPEPKQTYWSKSLPFKGRRSQRSSWVHQTQESGRTWRMRRISAKSTHIMMECSGNWEGISRSQERVQGSDKSWIFQSQETEWGRCVHETTYMSHLQWYINDNSSWTLRLGVLWSTQVILL